LDEAWRGRSLATGWRAPLLVETLVVEPPKGSRTSGAVPGVRQDGARETQVPWLVLVISGVLEAVWATALGRSEGFTRLAPSVTFAVSLLLSMAGLAYAMRALPVSTAYAVWVGIGASLTVAYGMLTGVESASVLKVVLVVGIACCVMGLKYLH
jgi:quaternary ammonium compound-resistance protein SugE